MKTKARARIAAGVALAMPALATTAAASKPAAKAGRPLVYMREYQRMVFADHTSKVLMLEWSRQIGKSFTLANWCADRLLRQLARHDEWLITVLSNSKDNGGEFAMKVAAAVRKMARAADEVVADFPDPEALGAMRFEEMRFEIRIRIGAKLGRVLVLAANPRTARGFSGDLVLDEFAFHEDAAAIWAAAEPIVSASPEFLCRIASTHNGRSSMFNMMIQSGKFPVNSVRRSDAWRISRHDPVAPLIITSLSSGREITPDEAEAEAMDRREYRQNYENEPADEMGALLTREMIMAAQRPGLFAPDEGEWSPATLVRLWRTNGEFSVGQDVGRNHDLSVVSVLVRTPMGRQEVARLTMRGVSLAEQRRQMEALIGTIGPRIVRVVIDMTGLGTGLVDELTDRYGTTILGVNFSSMVPVTPEIEAMGRKALTMAVTEKMALQLLALFEERRIEINDDADLYDDLRKPGRKLSADGKRVSIAAQRDQDGHADRFWALALAEHGFQEGAAGAFDLAAVQGVLAGPPPLGGHPIITEWDAEMDGRGGLIL